MEMDPSFFEEETRHGFFITPFMKRCWASQMEVLQGIDDICRKYNIRWFSHYGTMLGAVRHGGYVPWDDDMDICMLREDVEKFAEAVKKENTELRLYSIRDDPTGDHINEQYTNIIARVINSDRILSVQLSHEKYHDCFFACGVDIFILDYVSSDPEFEKNRAEMIEAVEILSSTIEEGNQVLPEVRESMEDLEAIAGWKFDWDKPLDHQFYRIVDNIFKECPVDKRSDGVAFLQEVYNELHKPPFHVRGYDSYFEVPFEMMKVRLSQGFLEMMKIYYYNFALYYRGGGGHEYPFYEKQMQTFTDHNAKIPFSYAYDPEELPENLRKDTKFPKDDMRKLLSLLDRCFTILETQVNQTDVSTLLQLLENIQQLMITAGNLLEQVRGTDFLIVHKIEAFCEEIYQVYSGISSSSESDAYSTDQSADLSKLLETYRSIAKDITGQYLNREEILIIPYRAKYWYAIKTVYEKYLRNSNTDVYVMPIPLHYCDAVGQPVNTFYEGDRYPKDVKITDYLSYDMRRRIPDKIYIQTDFDAKNPVITIEPYYYSDQLVRYTPCLIYAPWMLLDENLENDILLEKELRLSGCMPGVVHADWVMLQSEDIKTHFLNVLKEFAGEENLPELEKKLVTDHYPVLEYIHSLETTSDKARDFYYISIAGVLYEGEKYLDALEEEVNTLLTDGDLVSLVVEKRAEITLKTVDAVLYDKLCQSVDALDKQDAVNIYPEPETPEERAAAVARYDQYFGDEGPEAWLFKHFKKPVKINTVDYNKLS